MSQPLNIAILGTLDTKGAEVEFIRDQISALGHTPIIFDVGVTGEATLAADYDRATIARRGGTALEELLINPSRQRAVPVMVSGAVDILRSRLNEAELDGVLALGGTQGTSLCSQVMQELPYGLPKLMVSTCASGDTSTFVGTRDITMMFSVCDILGLNPLMRKILASAAGAAVGMATAQKQLASADTDRRTIGMTNLGVLTDGACLAKERLEQRGFEVMVFHAVGSGGLAMEQLMHEGLLAGVFDYGLGDISDEMFDGLRAANRTRLTVAGKLGIPQVVCPGGAEHIGVFVDEPNVVPERFQDHLHVFHSPLILAPRLKPNQLAAVGKEICTRLEHSIGPTAIYFPLEGTSRYGVADGPLRDPEGDIAFLNAIKKHLPTQVELVEHPQHAEHPEFIEAAVDKLLSMIN